MLFIALRTQLFTVHCFLTTSRANAVQYLIFLLVNQYSGFSVHSFTPFLKAVKTAYPTCEYFSLSAVYANTVRLPILIYGLRILLSLRPPTISYLGFLLRRLIRPICRFLCSALRTNLLGTAYLILSASRANAVRLIVAIRFTIIGCMCITAFPAQRTFTIKWLSAIRTQLIGFSVSPQFFYGQYVSSSIFRLHMPSRPRI